jgi:hypothetical protein
MFNQLYKLYGKRNSNRTPLEDFNTECFAGVLRMSPDVLKSFVKFLKLPAGEYNVSTQAHYSLEETSNCIVDMVLESESTVCFIENKVNSKEGWEQLDRYTQVLNRYYANDELEKKKNIHLKYCTKNVDIKQRTEPNFFQLRWFDIGKLLSEHHTKDVLGNDYLKFLQQNKMAIDPSISTDTVVTLKNYDIAYKAMEYHIDESAKNFKKAFPKANLARRHKSDLEREIWEHKRISNAIEYPLQDETVRTIIVYSIDFDDVCLQTQIWIRAGHPQIDEIKTLAEASQLFDPIKSNKFGLGLRIKQPLYAFIDMENSDNAIKDWFAGSFKKIRTFIDTTPKLGWSESVRKVEKE